ncbi:dnaJ subfamily B member 8 isoform X2 [Carex littledalei]|uniref:DnaJ subfamily B member 8 isoform X2 n=1 Tax=Carex littledalei TaxID=544730 RepID=A0A833R3E5_9POAL|nr:dnaJ subfamily B member 8 isoform X2 [Carex littledalei]
MTMNGILFLCCSPRPLFSFHRYRNPNPISLAFSLSFAIPSRTSRFRCGSGSGPKRRRSRAVAVRASRRESPYEVLGVPPSATPRDIKRAYRKLALQFHPDVNKEPNAQERFMRIKHAYNTLINSESRFNATNSTRANYSTPSDKKSTTEDEQFYGFVDFLRDLQEEFRNWEADLNREEKPKSLWEELAEIGEEFVEFLEKELNIKDTNLEDDSTGSQRERRREEDVQRQPSVEESIDEVEAALAKLKKELGL